MADTISSADTYNQVANIMDNILGTIQSNIFNAIQSVWFSTLAHVIVALSLCIYIFFKIGKEWSRNDFFQIGIWIFTYSILSGIFYSYANYSEFVNFLNLPINYVYAGISEVTSENFQMNKSIGDTIDFIGTIWSATGEPNLSVAYIAKIISAFLLWLVMLFFILYIIIFTIMIKFMASLMLAICPLFIPFLIIKQLRGYFFSWLKLYVSIALQAPFAYLIIGVVFNAQQAIIGTKATEAMADASDIEILPIILVPLIMAIISIAAISKIPTWTQQIVGSGDGGNSTGLAGLIGGAGAIAGQGIKGTMNAKGQGASWGRSLLAGAVSTIPAGIGQYLSDKIIKGGKPKDDKKPKGDGNDKDTSDNGKSKAEPTPYK